jgi:hypothetical protein
MERIPTVGAVGALFFLSCPRSGYPARIDRQRASRLMLPSKLSRNDFYLRCNLRV